MAIYLDYNATTPLRPEALEIMMEILAAPANPSSVHAYGRQAKKWLEDARKAIAGAISAWPDEVIFTGSGTEANAMALAGFPGCKIVASAVEHSSVLRYMDTGLRRYDVINADQNGLVSLEILEKTLIANEEATLVSVMLANNETGVIQPVADIARLCKKHGALLHTDAAQAFGKIPVDFGALGADMMTVSAHKCGGPLGAAALILRRDLPIQPLLLGGGQELRRRAGTENVAAIAGFARAVERFDFARMQQLRKWMEGMEHVILSVAKDLQKREILRYAQDDMVIAAAAPRLPNTRCIAMPGVSSEVQLMNFDLKGFAVSAGSACSSGRIEPSHVLKAMGLPEHVTQSAIRISGGWATAEAEIQAFTQAWQELAGRLRKKG